MISEGHRVNFQTLCRAAASGALTLMECKERATGKIRAVICAVYAKNCVYHLVPFGHLCDGDPYVEYLPPHPNDDKKFIDGVTGESV